MPAKPFEIVQMDLKYIRDHKALSRDQITHLDRYGILNFQWDAPDVTSRFKLMAYSQERTPIYRGLCFYLWTIAWLPRKAGAPGRSSSPRCIGARSSAASPGSPINRGSLIQNPTGHPEKNPDKSGLPPH